MGLIKALVNDVKGVLADQWLEYFNCDALPENVLLVKGTKYVSKGGSNVKGNDNVISDGARIDIADGQFMMIVENGLIVDFCAEPGQYTYKTDLQPSLLSGGFSAVGKTFKEIGKRFVAGGQPMSKQVVYYVNTKEILGNKWGAGAVPFRDSEFNFTMKIGAYGEYSYKITNPLLFYKNVCGNVTDYYTRDKIDSQLKAELQTAMQPALGRVALNKVAYDQLPLYTKEISDELNKELSDKWENLRGINVVSFTMQSVTPDDESAAKIAQFQESRVYTDAGMMGARIGSAQASAMEKAAENDAGAMTGFMGMGFAQNAGGANAAQFFQMAEQNKANQPETSAPAPAPVATADGWTCTCGAVNKGKFCSECGAKKPEGAPTYQCDKCGWVPEDPTNPPKFCPECGDKFDDADKK